MNTVKSNLILSFLLISSMIFAQTGGQRGERQDGHQGPPPVPNEKQIKEMVSNLAKEISLSDEQEAEILKLHTAHFETVKKKVSGNTRPTRQEMETFKNDFENQIKAVLNKEQIKVYETFMKKHNAHHKRKH